MSFRCLIVDDSREFLASAASLLTQQGVEIVGQAQTSAQAVALADSTRPDVVLVDVELGPDSGIDLAMRMAARELTGRVVLISQRDRSQIDVPDGSSGVAGFIRKDRIDASTIETVVDEAVQDFATVLRVAPARRVDPATKLAALRRVVAVLAHGAEPQTVFRLVAHEVADVLGIHAVGVFRYHAESQMISKLYGTHGDRSAALDGESWPLRYSPEIIETIATGLPVRYNGWSTAEGIIAERHRAEAFGDSLAAPILIDGAVWGGFTAYAEHGQFVPPGCEHDLADFTNLIAGAVANFQARSLATSQDALRRVATLVAQGAEPDVVFVTVAQETSKMLDVNAVSLIRYDALTGQLTKIYGTHGRRSPIRDGTSWPIGDSPEAEGVARTGRPSRVDDWTDIPGPTADEHRAQGFGGAIAAPIMVDGALWGMLAAYAEGDQILAPNCENDLADFTNLMASAIASAQTRHELRGLAERQGEALRRVATLVAQRRSSTTVFDAVASEAQRALQVSRVDVCRYSDGAVVSVGSTARVDSVQDDPRRPLIDRVVERVIAAASILRIDGSDSAAGFTSTVSAPIRVDGDIWGVIVALNPSRLANDTETRLADFTHLVASSIANVNARDDLIASRRRIVTASDDTRRRIERNLHDGVQQRMVALALQMRALCLEFPLPDGLQSRVDDVIRGIEELQEEVRSFSQGLHPVLLSRSGLAPALRDLVRRSPIIVDLILGAIRRCAEDVETTVYYVISEALTNAVKHADATTVLIQVDADEHEIRARIADDGRGGASPERGSGLIGLADRVEAAGGVMTLSSPAGKGTTVIIEIPLEDGRW